MKLTRRDFATVLGPGAALAGTSAAGQVPAPSPPAGGDALLDAARARSKANGAILDEQTVPIDTQPAFQFKA